MGIRLSVGFSTHCITPFVPLCVPAGMYMNWSAFVMTASCKKKIWRLTQVEATVYRVPGEDGHLK